MPDKQTKSWFSLVIVISCVFMICVAFYNFYYKKNYSFIIEAKCNNKTETCFLRDCTSGGSDCSTDSKQYYKEYTINAKDFLLCKNENCKNACISDIIQCTPIYCTQDDITNGNCVTPSNQ